MSQELRIEKRQPEMAAADNGSEKQHQQRQQNYLNRRHRYRHSHNDRTSSFLKSACQNRVENHIESKSQSSSSAASDSAFSQSQTTLESESEQSATDLHEIRRSDSTTSNKELDIKINDQNQFEIIWKNLSYRIPDKRLANFWKQTEALSSYFSSKNKQKQQQQPVDHVKPSSEDYRQTQNKVGEGNLDPTPTLAKPRKIIFSNLNGCVKSGQLTAILGPSGAGKTTFLKCLTNNIVKGVTGSIDITGAPTSSHHLKLCIIPQKGE